MDEKFENAKEQLQVDVNEEVVEEMPIIGSILALITLFIGLYMGFTQNIGYFTLSAVACIFVVMVSFSIGWNKVFIQNDYAPVVPIIHLALGSLIQFGLLAFSISQLTSSVSIFVIGSISTSVSLLYQFTLLKLIFINWDRDKIEIEQHPYEENDDTVYVFKEEVYIPLLEKKSLEKQDTS